MDADDSKAVTVRTMDIVVALILLGVAAVVMSDSVRLGVRWQETDGPTAGYFPFYVGLLLALASVVNLAQAVGSGRSARERVFVTVSGFRRVLAVALPFGVFVFAVSYLGIYVASAIFIAVFMWFAGQYSPLRGISFGVAIAAALFLMFEIWFLVPLPKGPLEHFLGY